MMKNEQQPLFGDQDVYVNTLESEITLVRDEIKKAVKAIENKEEKVGELNKRLSSLIDVKLALRKGTVRDEDTQAPTSNEETRAL